MLKSEFEKIYKEIQQYPNFDGSYMDWYKELIDYPYIPVLNNLKNHKSINAPIPKQLIGKLEKEEKIEDWITECEYCKKRFTIQNNDMTDYEKHFRKCSKIDFIDRMSKRKHGKGIERADYYNMQEDIFERIYRKAMEYYKEQPKNDLLKTL